MEEKIEVEENLVYEDEYESYNEEILSQLSQMNLHNQSLQALQLSNQKKLSKLKLLLYQKFLNIIYSIISQHFHRHFVSLMTFSKIQLKGYVMNNKKFKLPQFYLKTMVKHKERQEKNAKIREQHEKYNQRRIEEKSNKKKTNAEIEYEKYQEKSRLAKVNKEEREKMKNDLIRKETYADNIYRYLVKRRFFRLLKLSQELNGVAYLFIDNIDKRIVLIEYIRRMQVAAKAKRETRLKAEQLKLLNAHRYYQKVLKGRIVNFLYNFAELSLKVQAYLIKQFKIKRRKNSWLKLKKAIAQESHITKDITNIIIDKRRLRLKKCLYFQLKGMIKDSRDEKMKLEIMSKLKDKAKMLLNDFK